MTFLNLVAPSTEMTVSYTNPYSTVSSYYP